jgi:hypothetical protein
MLCYAMLCYAMLCCAMLCYAMLCYAVLCRAVLCCAVLCCEQGSSPAVQAGRWYVAVVGRNLTTAQGLTEKKFNLALSVGPSYDSTWAICITVLVPFAVAFCLVACTHTWLYKTPYFYLYASTQVLTNTNPKSKAAETAIAVVEGALNNEDPQPRISAMTQSSSNAYLEMKELKFGPVLLHSHSLTHSSLTLCFLLSFLYLSMLYLCYLSIYRL